MNEAVMTHSVEALLAEIGQYGEDGTLDYLYNDIGPLLYAYAMPPLIRPTLSVPVEEDA